MCNCAYLESAEAGSPETVVPTTLQRRPATAPLRIRVEDAEPNRPRVPASPGDPSGSRFGDYVLEREVGRGGMGIVYEATHVATGGTVALKLMRDLAAADPELRARFIREARLTAWVNHPNVIPVLKSGEHSGRLFIAMRLIDGPSLAEILASNSDGMAVEPVVRLAHQVASALDAAHQRGLVHRDVKPGNILVSQDGEHVYLSDFGLTRFVDDHMNLTVSGQFVGTAAYCSPEQIRGEPVGPATDVYALGCMVFHMLTGRQPFERDFELALMFAHVHAPVPDVGAVAPQAASLSGVVARAMAKSARERFTSATQFAQALADAVISPVPQPRSSWPAARSSATAAGPPTMPAGPGWRRVRPADPHRRRHGPPHRRERTTPLSHAARPVRHGPAPPGASRSRCTAP